MLNKEKLLRNLTSKINTKERKHKNFDLRNNYVIHQRNKNI